MARKCTKIYNTHARAQTLFCSLNLYLATLPLPSWFAEAPSTLIRFQTKTELFFNLLRIRPSSKLQRRKNRRKWSHSKTLSRVERFENDAFWKRCFLVWTVKTMLFENGNVIKTTRPWVSKMADRRYHVASISRQFRRPIYWNAHASSSFDHTHLRV